MSGPEMEHGGDSIVSKNKLNHLVINCLLYRDVYIILTVVLAVQSAQAEDRSRQA